MKAVCTEVEPVERIDCGCACTPVVYHSEWDRLCKVLFGCIPPGMDSERQLPNIGIWKDGVTLEGIASAGVRLEEYSFTIEEDEDSDPKQSDVIFYNGRFYVIGEGKTVENPYLEIEPEVLWVFQDLESMNDVYSNLSWNIK